MFQMNVAFKWDRIQRLANVFNSICVAQVKSWKKKFFFFVCVEEKGNIRNQQFCGDCVNGGPEYVGFFPIFTRHQLLIFRVCVCVCVLFLALPHHLGKTKKFVICGAFARAINRICFCEDKFLLTRKYLCVIYTTTAIDKLSESNRWVEREKKKQNKNENQKNNTSESRRELG